MRHNIEFRSETNALKLKQRSCDAQTNIYYIHERSESN